MHCRNPHPTGLLPALLALALTGAAGPVASAGTDVTPPVLTLFNASATLNLGKSATPFKVGIKTTDDLSGLQYLSFRATGPSGQTLVGGVDPGYPSLAFTGNGGFPTAGRFLEPGAWKITLAFGSDWAGNYFEVDEAALALLGNTSFTVVNNGGFDRVKPGLTSGKIQTPSVSLSSVAPGTAGVSPFVGVKLTATDAGNTALAGVRGATVQACQLADPAKCINLFGQVVATGLATATFSTKAQVAATQGNPPGDYILKKVVVSDHAGNETELLSTLFGGTTDFGTLFPTTVIKLKP